MTVLTINDLKDQIDSKTSNFVLLTFATMGIYPLLWLYRNYLVIDKITKTKTADDVFIIAIAACLGFSWLFYCLGDETADIISGVLNLAVMILYIIWAFRAKKALEEYALNSYKIDLRMNGFHTFFFNVYYINYCINDLPNAKRKQQIISGEIENQQS